MPTRTGDHSEGTRQSRGQSRYMSRTSGRRHVSTTVQQGIKNKKIKSGQNSKSAKRDYIFRAKNNSAIIGFLNLSATHILSWRILCYKGLSCIAASRASAHQVTVKTIKTFQTLPNFSWPQEYRIPPAEHHCAGSFVAVHTGSVVPTLRIP